MRPVPMLDLAHGVRDDARDIEHRPRAPERGGSAFDGRLLGQHADDGLRSGEAPRAQQDEHPIVWAFEDRHLTEGGEVVDASVGARVGAEHDSLFQEHPHAVGHSPRHLVGPDAKRPQRVRSKGRRDRDVRGVASARDEDPTDALDVVPRVEGVPGAADKRLEPTGEVHRRRILRTTDVAEVTGAIPRRNVHATTEGDGQVGEVATDPPAFIEDLPGGLGRLANS